MNQAIRNALRTNAWTFTHDGTVYTIVALRYRHARTTVTFRAFHGERQTIVLG